VRANRWGQAKREVIALKPLITERLKDGITIRQIWIELNGAGQISITLRNFYAQVQKLILLTSPAARVRSRQGQLPAPLSLSRSTSLIAPVPPAEAAVTRADDPHFATFGHNNRPDMDENW